MSALGPDGAAVFADELARAHVIVKRLGELRDGFARLRQVLSYAQPPQPAAGLVCDHVIDWTRQAGATPRWVSTIHEGGVSAEAFIGEVEDTVARFEVRLGEIEAIGLALAVSASGVAQ